MAKKSVGDLGKADLEGKVVFVRADLNVRAFLLLCRNLSFFRDNTSLFETMIRRCHWMETRSLMIPV